MKTYYNEIVTNDGNEAVEFHVVTKRGSIAGIYLKAKDRLMIFSVYASNGLKGLMNVLINKFKTRKVTFTPLITDGIENSVRGEIKTIQAGAEGNPYGEPVKILETVWRY